jgi:hypothetical protein
MTTGELVFGLIVRRLLDTAARWKASVRDSLQVWNRARMQRMLEVEFERWRRETTRAVGMARVQIWKRSSGFEGENWGRDLWKGRVRIFRPGGIGAVLSKSYPAAAHMLFFLRCWIRRVSMEFWRYTSCAEVGEAGS